MSPRVKHIVYAFAISPLTVVIPIMMFAGFEPLLFPDYGLRSFWLVTTMVALSIAYAAVLVIGLPAHLILCRLGKSTVVNHVLIGLTVTLIPIGRILITHDMSEGDVVFSALLLISAATVSFVFGLITVTFYEKGSLDSGKAAK